MIGRAHHVAYDCADPLRLASFCSALLGLPITFVLRRPGGRGGERARLGVRVPAGTRPRAARVARRHEHRSRCTSTSWSTTSTGRRPPWARSVPPGSAAATTSSPTRPATRSAWWPGRPGRRRSAPAGRTGARAATRTGNPVPRTSQVLESVEVLGPRAPRRLGGTMTTQDDETVTVVARIDGQGGAELVSNGSPSRARFASIEDARSYVGQHALDLAAQLGRDVVLDTSDPAGAWTFVARPDGAMVETGNRPGSAPTTSSPVPASAAAPATFAPPVAPSAASGSAPAGSAPAGSAPSAAGSGSAGSVGTGSPGAPGTRRLGRTAALDPADVRPTVRRSAAARPAGPGPPPGPAPYEVQPRRAAAHARRPARRSPGPHAGTGPDGLAGVRPQGDVRPGQARSRERRSCGSARPSRPSSARCPAPARSWSSTPRAARRRRPR